MKESEKIQKKIDALLAEKSDLVNKIKPVPEGHYEKKLLGYPVQYNGGSLFDAIRNTDYSRDNAKFIPVLKYDGEEITKGKLNELRSSIIKENEPFQKSIKEIDELIPILKRKLIEAKANEILEATNVEPVKKKFKGANVNLSEHGELRKFVEEFIVTKEFEELNIPKHQTLKANHKISLKKILAEKYPEYDINFDSFLTILRELDYSKPRKK